MKTPFSYSYNQDLYRTIDGHYSSYWAGKFANSFVQEGHKALVENELNKVYLYMKLHLDVLAIEVLLEKMEKIKPTFKLKSVTIAGKKREFPVFLAPEKQRNRAIRNIKENVTKRKEWYLNQRVINELVDLRAVKSHELIKQRDESFREAIKNRFNMRYSY